MKHLEEIVKLLSHIEENPSATQRELMGKLDVSLGKVNFIVNALVDKAKEHRANNPPQMGRLPSGDFIGKTGGMSLHKVKPKKKRGGRSITIKY